MAQSLEAKIVVLGSQGVGKTSLVHRYVKNQFSPAAMTSTVGASFLTKRVVDDESDTVVRLQIWDTAGQERFRSISRLYYRGANACILCYSITDSTSFTEMGIWLTELRRNLPPDIILHVVGTKSDMVARDPSLRQVPFERCIAYIADNLAPGVGGTPPVTATPSTESRGFLFGRVGSSNNATATEQQHHHQTQQAPPHHSTAIDGGRSPSSKRSSGFWAQEVGWDCCHEVSAENGEGVDEVFRVITRKLVEQHRSLTDGLTSAAQTSGIPGSTGVGGSSGMTPGVDGAAGDGAGGYFDRPGGSFRVGRDRRSWFGVPVETYVAEGGGEGGEDGTGGQVIKTRRKCC